MSSSPPSVPIRASGSSSSRSAATYCRFWLSWSASDCIRRHSSSPSSCRSSGSDSSAAGFSWTSSCKYASSSWALICRSSMDWSICGVSFSSCFCVISSFTVLPLLICQITPAISGKTPYFSQKQQGQYSISWRKAQERGAPLRRSPRPERRSQKGGSGNHRAVAK